MGALKHLDHALRPLGLVSQGPGRWQGPDGRRVDASRRRLLILWPLAAGPSRCLSFWAQPPVRRVGPETGDLAFDGDVRTEGPEAEVRRWMNASARAAVRWLLFPGPGALRLRAERLILIRRRWRPELFQTLELLTHPRWNTAPDPARDPDPRVRALAALHLTRHGESEALEPLLADEALPDWIRLEAAFALFRVARARGDRPRVLRLARRISELASDRRRARGQLSLAEGAGDLGLALTGDDSGGQPDS